MTGWKAGDYLDRPLRDLLDDVGGPEPVPAAGSVLALTAALAAGLTAKVARRSTAHRGDAVELARHADRLRDQLAPLVTADATAYSGVLVARGDGAAAAAAAMAHASGPPATVVAAGPVIADLAGSLAASGNPNLRHDALVAAQLATVAAEAAAALVAANNTASAATAATVMEEQ